MYLHIGGKKIISLDQMIGIFSVDLKNNQNNQDLLKKFPGKYLEKTETKKNSSIVITKKKIYYSSISPLTLTKRIGQIV